ncbi:MAG TPA: hypothetical protein VNO18_04060 [Xanthobacteraceae bacterium]|nr:hypothetical protein [Xanthobacteraceae bacterium]
MVGIFAAAIVSRSSDSTAKSASLPGSIEPLMSASPVKSTIAAQADRTKVGRILYRAPTMLTTGAPILNLRDVVHGGFKVVGPGNLILFAVHTVDKGKPLYDLVK